MRNELMRLNGKYYYIELNRERRDRTYMNSVIGSNTYGAYELKCQMHDSRCSNKQKKPECIYRVF